MKTSMSRARIALAAALFPVLTACAAAAAADKPFRPPAVPLVTHDPYFSIWSPHDRLTDGPTTHWTGRPHRLSGLARIDGKAYRFMGDEPKDVPALPQKSVEVLPTRTIYEFEGAGITMSLTFVTPALPDDLDLLSRPITCVVADVKAADGSAHSVTLYFDAGAELAVNAPEQQVTWGREEVATPAGTLRLLKVGSKDQPVLAKKGDDLRIDWGWLYAGARDDALDRAAVCPGPEARAAFAAGRALPDEPSMPRAVKDGRPALALQLKELELAAGQEAVVPVLLGYDDLWSIRYMGRRLRPYWRRSGAEAADIFRAAMDGRMSPGQPGPGESIYSRCHAFDRQFTADLEKAGGPKYAKLAALAYRQALAGNKLAADAAGKPLFFPKECFSNGCIATVDVIYPMAPIFLLFGPAMAKATLVPVMEYAMSPRWKLPFAPHDLGTYPIADGQVYGEGEAGEENQMPVEESGNLLIAIGALAKMEGNASFAERYWPALAKWAVYLKEKGLDPAHQLCTDDFAGHLAHNVNLSAKAIVGLGCYAGLCDVLGKKDEAAAYRKAAEEYARAWADRADDGDHYRLAFDKPGTWSQKYNLVWDRVLGLNLFPPSVARKEMAFYRKTQDRYGIALDNRQPYTKIDWVLWTATLTGARDDFEAIADRAYAFLDESPSRVPMSDWYWTKDGKVSGFQARPVVGGVFIPMLGDGGTWRRWAGRGAKVEGAWAPMPSPPSMRPLVAASRREAATWRYTFRKPAEGWAAPGLDDSAWKAGPAGFGSRGTPGSAVRTEWTTADIWIRRSFDLAEVPAGDVQLLVHHDEDVEVYVNGVLAATAGGWTIDYELVPMSAEGRAALKAGTNVLAGHCHQTSGGQYIDVGIVSVVAGK